MALPWNNRYARAIYSPRDLPGLQAYYDLQDTSSYITATGVKLLGDRSGNSTENAFASSGAASNTATAPTASITGNQTLTADIQFADYTPATDHTLFSKLAGNSGIEWLILTTGVSRIRIGDGAAITNFDSTVAIPATDFVRGTLRVVYTDNTNMVTTWNGATVGTTVTVNKVLANGAATATIGTSCAGVIYSLTVGSVYNFAPSSTTKLAASFVAPTTGETWTINTSGDLGARICGARDLVQMTGANQPTISAGGALFDGVNDYMKCAAFALAQPTTVYFVGQQVTWTISETIFDGDATNSMRVNQAITTPNFTQYSGGVAGANNGGWAVATNAVLSVVYSSSSGGSRVNKGTSVANTNGSAPANGFTLATIGAASSGYCNILVYAVLIYSTAHDTATQDRVIQWAGRKYGIAV